MIHKAITSTEVGTITTRLVTRSGCIPFKIVLFRMSDEFAEKQKNKVPVIGLSVYAFDSGTLEWKLLLGDSDFDGKEVVKKEAEGTLVEYALGIVNSVLGIRIAPASVIS